MTVNCGIHALGSVPDAESCKSLAIHVHTYTCCSKDNPLLEDRRMQCVYNRERKT